MERWFKAASVHRAFVADVNTDGSFLFPQLPRGYGKIIAICDGFVSKRDRNKPAFPQCFDLQSDGQEIVVEMEPTATFSGKVVNTDGQPVVGAIVTFSPNVAWENLCGDIFMGRHYSATTDAKGEFSVVNLPGHGRESYQVWSANYELPIETVENQPPRRERTVELSPGGEKYEVIQVIQKGQDYIEGSVE